jgi:hypothetical protein
MVIKQSPGGSRYPYNYKGGELFGMHLGSFFTNEAGAIDRLKKEEAFIQARNMRLGMMFDFYQTRMTNNIIIEFIETIYRLQNHITKIAIVGCSLIDRWRINRKAKNRLSLPLRYYDDQEDAKTWLVGGR